jgi:hypothetical protein
MPPPAATPGTGHPEPATTQGAAEAAETGTPEDVFTQAARARREGTAAGNAPKIKRKPKKIPVITKHKAWFRTHPDAIFQGLMIFQDPTSEEMEVKPHYVLPDLEPELFGMEGTYRATGYLICTASGNIQLFLVREADDSGRLNQAAESKHEACEDALNEWTRLVWDAEAKQYEINHAEWSREPRWPEDLSEESILRLAFGKAFLDDLDHPLLQRLDSPA